jgi:hypothetical protein
VNSPEGTRNDDVIFASDPLTGLSKRCRLTRSRPPSAVSGYRRGRWKASSRTARYASGEAAKVSPTVRDLTGQRPRDIARFARDRDRGVRLRIDPTPADLLNGLGDSGRAKLLLIRPRPLRLAGRLPSQNPEGI